MTSARERLTDYWNFYVKNSHIENQPEVLNIIETADKAILEAIEEQKEKDAKIADSHAVSAEHYGTEAMNYRAGEAREIAQAIRRSE